MTNPEDVNPVGHTIEGYDILGREYVDSDRWVGADLELRVPPLGRFFIRVVTKERFASEEVEDWHDKLDTLDPSDFDDDNFTDIRQPFVLNDRLITQNVLDEKFTNRVIKDDLAASMWVLDSGEEG